MNAFCGCKRTGLRTVLQMRLGDVAKLSGTQAHRLRSGSASCHVLT